MAFVRSDALSERAASVFAEHERRIRDRLPDVEVRHRDGASITGVLTTGDVDVHVRATASAFAHAREALLALYEPMYVDAWTEESAFFADPASQPLVEVALTVVGTLDDLHHGAAWDQIAADGQLRQRYNALKREHAGRPLGDYQAAKRAFFHDNFALGAAGESTEA